MIDFLHFFWSVQGGRKTTGWPHIQIEGAWQGLGIQGLKLTPWNHATRLMRGGAQGPDQTRMGVELIRPLLEDCIV